MQVSLAGKILARLQMHPIRATAAKDLNTAMSMKVKSYYRMVFPPAPGVLVSPIERGGLDFPDFEKLNAAWAVANVHRALNSRNSTINEVSQIMHATMQCFGKISHRCYLPFAPEKVTYGTWNGPKKNNFLTWEIARVVCKDLSIQLIPSKRINTGQWAEHNKRSNQAEYIDPKLAETQLLNKRLEKVVNEQCAEAILASPVEWATDGSCDTIQDSLSPRRCAIAVIGPINFAARLMDEFAVIQDAELAAVAVAVTFDSILRRKGLIRPSAKSVIYTDHLNTVRSFEAIRKRGAQEPSPHAPSRHMMRWAYDEIISNPNVTLIHQKAHTEEDSVAARLNDTADKAAKEARGKDVRLQSPAPHADKYSLYSSKTGISHAHPMRVLSDLLTEYMHPQRPTINDVNKYQPRYLYTKAKSAFSIQVQLQVRSSQLPTYARKIARSLEITGTTCSFCEQPAEEADEHHIFVACAGTQRYRNEGVRLAGQLVDRWMNDKQVEDRGLINRHKQLVDRLMNDNNEWTNSVSLYWKGELPGRFTYRPDLSKLYVDLTARCIMTTGRIWGAFCAKEAKTRGW